MQIRVYSDQISVKLHLYFLPVAASSSSPKSCMISPIDFSISSILLPEINKLHTHLINPTDNISWHFIKSVLHLFQHILDKSIELFGGRIFRDSWVVIHCDFDWGIWIFYKITYFTFKWLYFHMGLDIFIYLLEWMIMFFFLFNICKFVKCKSIPSNYTLH